MAESTRGPGEKRRRHKQRRPDPRRRVLLIAGVTLAVVVVFGGVAFVSYLVYNRFRTDLPTVAVPTAFDPYEAPEGAFRCVYPAGWKTTREGFKDHYRLTCTRGGVSVHVSQGLVGSLLGDIAGAVGGGPFQEASQSPTARVHEAKRAAVAEELGLTDYQPEPPEDVSTGFGPGRREAFTASGSFGRKRRGYRATVLGRMTQFDVVCQCPPADWENLRPAFAKCIESLGPGQDP